MTQTGVSPLMAAACRGYQEVVKLLIEAGAMINIQAEVSIMMPDYIIVACSWESS